LRANDFAIDMLFEYEEEDDGVHWCGARVRWWISLESQRTSMCLLDWMEW
jgi:hypothetical protein